jgi:enoyl-CoA hydratase/carnithine racemase
LPARLSLEIDTRMTPDQRPTWKEGLMPTHVTTQAEDLLLVEATDGIATVALNRPGQFNALSSALIDRMQSTLDRIAADSTVRVVVLAARGRGFCSGHDLKEIRAMSSVADVESLFSRCSRMMMTFMQMPQPVIAKVHGLATAAGCQLVATCDLAVASTTATFATPGVNIGAFCSTPGVALGRAVGRKHAMEMLLTGAPISADQACAIGLVNRVVSPEALDAEVSALATLVASKSSAAIASGKQVFYRQLDMPLGEAYDIAGHSIACDFFTEDGKEGVDAFLAKRTARWSGRA